LRANPNQAESCAGGPARERVLQFGIDAKPPTVRAVRGDKPPGSPAFADDARATDGQLIKGTERRPISIARPVLVVQRQIQTELGGSHLATLAGETPQTSPVRTIPAKEATLRRMDR